MLITFDTNSVTPEDRILIAAAIGLAESAEAVPTPAEATEVLPEKPKRTRRTKAQIEADEAAAKAEQDAMQSAVEQAGEDTLADEPTPDSENAESDTAVTIAQLVEAATKLITRDKAAMRALLDDFGVRKVSDVPEDRMAEMIGKIDEALTKVPAA